MTDLNNETVRDAVRSNYAKVAETDTSCCSSGCNPMNPGDTAEAAGTRLGYSDQDLQAVPEGANMGLGCGNPTAIAALKLGETVLDLGSGGGFDCFLAAQQVGPDGQVIGVDMTPEMISKSRANAEKSGITNVEFRLGEIERLPVADGTVDAVMSNCVINLSPEKAQVFRDAFRVLKSGGRLSVSDVIATAPLPQSAREDLDSISACMGGAAQAEDVIGWLTDAGFTGAKVSLNNDSEEIVSAWNPSVSVTDYIASATIEAIKP